MKWKKGTGVGRNEVDGETTQISPPIDLHTDLIHLILTRLNLTDFVEYLNGC